MCGRIAARKRSATTTIAGPEPLTEELDPHIHADRQPHPATTRRTGCALAAHAVLATQPARWRPRCRPGSAAADSADRRLLDESGPDAPDAAGSAVETRPAAADPAA